MEYATAPGGGYPASYRASVVAGAARAPVPTTSPTRSGSARKLVLIRGLPGSGKSTLAASLGGRIFSADDYFIGKDGVYRFDASRLDGAHRATFQGAKEAMMDGQPLVIIDNTNLETWEMRPYVKEAIRHNYRVEIMEAKTPWAFNPDELARRNEHGVSRGKIEEMLGKYEHNVTVDKMLRLLGQSSGMGLSRLQRDRDRSLARSRSTPKAEVRRTYSPNEELQLRLRRLREKQKHELETHRQQEQDMLVRHREEADSLLAAFRDDGGAVAAAASAAAAAATAAWDDRSAFAAPASSLSRREDDSAYQRSPTESHLAARAGAPSVLPALALQDEDYAQTYATQLEQLASMGLTDDASNLAALKKTNGRVELALELIYSPDDAAAPNATPEQDVSTAPTDSTTTPPTTAPSNATMAFDTGPTAAALQPAVTAPISSATFVGHQDVTSASGRAADRRRLLQQREDEETSRPSIYGAYGQAASHNAAATRYDSGETGGAASTLPAALTTGHRSDTGTYASGRSATADMRSEGEARFANGADGAGAVQPSLYHSGSNATTAEAASAAAYGSVYSRRLDRDANVAAAAGAPSVRGLGGTSYSGTYGMGSHYGAESEGLTGLLSGGGSKGVSSLAAHSTTPAGSSHYITESERLALLNGNGAPAYPAASATSSHSVVEREGGQARSADDLGATGYLGTSATTSYKVTESERLAHLLSAARDRDTHSPGATDFPTTSTLSSHNAAESDRLKRLLSTDREQGAHAFDVTNYAATSATTGNHSVAESDHLTRSRSTGQNRGKRGLSASGYPLTSATSSHNAAESEHLERLLSTSAGRSSDGNGATSLASATTSPDSAPVDGAAASPSVNPAEDAMENVTKTLFDLASEETQDMDWCNRLEEQVDRLGAIPDADAELMRHFAGLLDNAQLKLGMHMTSPSARPAPVPIDDDGDAVMTDRVPDDGSGRPSSTPPATPEDAEAELLMLLDDERRADAWCSRFELVIDALGETEEHMQLRQQAETALRSERIKRILAEARAAGDSADVSTATSSAQTESSSLLRSLLPDLLPDVPLNDALVTLERMDNNVEAAIEALLYSQLLETMRAGVGADGNLDGSDPDDRRPYSAESEITPRGDFSPPRSARRQRPRTELKRLKRDCPQLSDQRLKGLLEKVGGNYELALEAALHYCEQHHISGFVGRRIARGWTAHTSAGGTSTAPQLAMVMQQQEAERDEQWQNLPEDEIAAGHRKSVAQLQSRHPRCSAEQIRRILRLHDYRVESADRALADERPPIDRFATSTVHRPAALQSSRSSLQASQTYTPIDMRGRIHDSDSPMSFSDFERLRKEALRKATDHSRSSPAISQYYASEARTYRRKMEAARRQEAQRIFVENNPDPSQGFIDLHHLRVAEALEIVRYTIDMYRRRRTRPKFVDFVTGAGRHSADGVAKLRPAVKTEVRAQGLRAEEVKSGVIRCHLSDLDR